MSRVQGKFWCFTNFDLSVKYEDWLEAKYVCWGIEKCPDTGKIHHQGYVEFEKNVSLGTKNSYLKKLHSSIHWEKRIGTADEAIKYCEKDGDFHELGQRPENKQGKRTDIGRVKDMVNEGKKLYEIVDECSSFQALRFAEKMIEIKEKKRNWEVEVYWYYGETGTGKTKRAYEEAGEDCWMSGRDLKWWQGYEGHEHVIFDDFRGNFCTLAELLRILDRFPYRVEFKGGSRQLLAKKIWITSPYHPKDVYKNLGDEKIDQLLRRITVIECFGDEKLKFSRYLKNKLGISDGI